MGTLQLQTFLTRYIRDKSLREKMKSLSSEMISPELGLSKEDSQLLATMDFAPLERAADHLEKERKAKRCADFAEFALVMQQVDLFEPFFLSFNQTYTDGLLTSEAEATRFYTYAQRYIHDNKLPDILADLATYSFQVFQVSQIAAQDSYNQTKLSWDKPLFLKQPFSIETFSYNLMEIIDNEEIKTIEDLVRIPKVKTTYFFQKDYLNLISSNIFEIDDLNFFQLLEKNLTGNEILKKVDSSDTKEEWKTMISELYDLEVIGTKG